MTLEAFFIDLESYLVLELERYRTTLTYFPMTLCGFYRPWIYRFSRVGRSPDLERVSLTLNLLFLTSNDLDLIFRNLEPFP